MQPNKNSERERFRPKKYSWPEVGAGAPSFFGSGDPDHPSASVAPPLPHSTIQNVLWYPTVASDNIISLNYGVAHKPLHNFELDILQTPWTSHPKHELLPTHFIPELVFFLMT